MLQSSTEMQASQEYDQEWKERVAWIHVQPMRTCKLTISYLKLQYLVGKQNYMLVYSFQGFKAFGVSDEDREKLIQKCTRHRGQKPPQTQECKW